MRYLLGTLSDEEKARLEEGYFSDDEAFEELEIAEDELIDRYVRGELSDGDRHQFERSLSRSPRLMERVQFARVLSERLPAPSMTEQTAEESQPLTEKSSWWIRLFGFSGESRAPRLAFAFSILLVLLGGLALLSGWLRLREESRRLDAQQAALEQRQRELDKQAADIRTQIDQLANQIPSQPPPSITPSPPKPSDDPGPLTGRSFLAITLLPGGTRSANGPNPPFQIPSGTVSIGITLNVRDSDYRSYRATVLTADHHRVSSSSDLRLQRTPSGDVLVISVSAKRLRPGDYLVRVEGRTASNDFEPADDYPFRVLR